MVTQLTLIREISHKPSIMSWSEYKRISLYTSTVLGYLAITTPHAFATDFTAGVVMEKMDADSRAAYIAGVIEGLAYARYEKDNEHLEGDKKTVEGIYFWLYDKPDTLQTIHAAFDKYPSYLPGAIIGNLVRQSCGG